MNSKLKALDNRILDHLKKEAARANAVLAEYENGCSDCRMLSNYLVKKTVGSFNPFGHGHIERKIGNYDTSIYCKTCNRCFYSTES